MKKGLQTEIPIRPLFKWLLNSSDSIFKRSPNKALEYLQNNIILTFLLGVLLIVFRCPSVIIYPQIVQEDGKIFFAEAFNQGWHSFFIPYAGYLHLVPRIIAFAASFAPLRFVPFFTMWSAILIEALTFAYLFSKDASKISLWLRSFIAFALICYPNAAEIHNLAHAQWYLIILSLIILLKEKPKAIDVVLLLFASLSSPIPIVLIPLAAWCAYENKSKILNFVALTLGGLIEALVIYNNSVRVIAPGPHHPSAVLHMIAGQVGSGSISGTLGVGMYGRFVNPNEALASLCVLGVIAWGIWKAPMIVKWLNIAGLFTFLITLKSGATWYGLATAGQGERYFFLLGLGLLATLFYLAQLRHRNVIFACLAGIGILFANGVYQNWHFDPGQPFISYEQSLQTYETSSPGAVVKIPEIPQNWTMDLIRK